MKKKFLIIFSILSILIFHIHPAFAFAERKIPTNIYVVQNGDTLPRIAQKYKTSVQDLKLSNGLQSESLIAGQKLWVPVMYEVSAGDSLKEIATRHHTSVEIIKTTNKLGSDQLSPGQVIKIIPKKLPMQGQHILMTKEEFRDWLFNSRFNRKINLIQQHHTWAPSYKTFQGTSHFQLLKGMENHHKKTMKWSNIAQNLTTFPDGRVAVSRPFNSAPEGSIGPKANAQGIAIENIGNFDHGNDVMTREQKDTIVYITALLCLKFGLTPSIDSITYHHWWHYKTKERVLDDSRDFDVKSCPGTNFFGGNTTTSAKNNFYPLVVKKMEEIKAEIE